MSEMEADYYAAGYLIGTLFVLPLYLFIIGGIYYLIRRRRIPFRRAVFNGWVIALSLILFLLGFVATAQAYPIAGRLGLWPGEGVQTAARFGWTDMPASPSNPSCDNDVTGRPPFESISGRISSVLLRRALKNTFHDVIRFSKPSSSCCLKNAIAATATCSIASASSGVDATDMAFSASDSRVKFSPILLSSLIARRFGAGLVHFYFFGKLQAGFIQ